MIAVVFGAYFLYYIVVPYSQRYPFGNAHFSARKLEIVQEAPKIILCSTNVLWKRMRVTGDEADETTFLVQYFFYYFFFLFFYFFYFIFQYFSLLH